MMLCLVKFCTNTAVRYYAILPYPKLYHHIWYYTTLSCILCCSFTFVMLYHVINGHVIFQSIPFCSVLFCSIEFNFIVFITYIF